MIKTNNKIKKMINNIFILNKKWFSNYKRLRAFTLLELIVVIAIIAILAVIAVPSFTKALAKARDAKRVADIKNIASALDRYYVDNGNYPVATSSIYSDPRGVNSTFIGNTTALQGLVPKYLSQIPQDPLSKGANLYWDTSHNERLQDRNGYYNYYYYVVDYSDTAAWECIGSNTYLTDKRYVLVYTLETATNTQNTFPCWGSEPENKQYWFLQQ